MLTQDAAKDSAESGQDILCRVCRYRLGLLWILIAASSKAKFVCGASARVHAYLEMEMGNRELAVSSQ